jgi:hypothetical protein
VEIGASGVEIYRDRRRLVRYALAGLAIAGACSLLVFADSGWAVNVAGVLGVLLFGGGGLYFLWRVARPEPVFVLDVVGVSGRGSATLRWDEIERMWVSRIDVEGSTAYTLAIKPIQPGLVRARQPAILRPFARLGSAIAGGAEMTLPLEGLQRPREEVLELVEQYARKPVDRAEADWAPRA